ACEREGGGGDWGARWFQPQGEPWTIECLILRDPDRRASAETIADVLRRTAGIRSDDVRVGHQGDVSTVWYSTYYRRIDRRAGTREIPDALRQDLTMIKELVDDHGRRLLVGARMVPSPLPVEERPEWDLRNADGRYTLQVAAFFTAPEVSNHKMAAVQYVEQLRKEGYEAYYHLGEAKSVVTIGAFGSEALVNRGGHLGYSERVRALQREGHFAYNLTNGRIWHQVVGANKAPVGSRLVAIPNRGDDVP
ncbi:MAG: hypothetical protein IID34_01565, partial [Planctomycetes bacterium]|nr:hypothetical protein [Planctomycetota bacterium]